MAEIARQAGVVRATIYVHYPTREALLDAVTDRAIAEVAEAIAAAEPEQGSAAEALTRVVQTTWRTLGRYHALVAINIAQHGHADLHAKHHTVLAALAPLIARGQADGSFSADAPVAWHLAMLLALVHAASGELQAGRVTGPRPSPRSSPRSSVPCVAAAAPTSAAAEPSLTVSSSTA